MTSAPPPGPARAFRTAIVPAAGLGTRFLPTTKSVPKELLPVVDTPAIEYIAAEAAEAGAERLVLVVSPGKESIARHFEPHKVVAPAPGPVAPELARLVPLLADRPAVRGQVTVYICENFACQAPVVGLEALGEALKASSTRTRTEA